MSDVNVFVEGQDDDFAVDFSQVDDLKFEAIPGGDYDGVLSGLEYKLSKSSNMPMWNAAVEIEGGDYNGRKLFGILSFSEKALSGTKMAIATFAPNLMEGPFNPKAIADSGDLLGTKVRVRVVIEMYEGQKRNRIKRWLTPKNTNEFLD